MCVTRGNKTRKGGSSRYAQGMDLTKRYRKKKKYSSKVNSYCDCSMPSQAGEDRNKQGTRDCSKPRPVKNAGLQQAYITSMMPENCIGKASLGEEEHSIGLAR